MQIISYGDKTSLLGKVREYFKMLSAEKFKQSAKH